MFFPSRVCVEMIRMFFPFKGERAPFEPQPIREPRASRREPGVIDRPYLQTGSCLFRPSGLVSGEKLPVPFAFLPVFDFVAVGVHLGHGQE